MQARVEVLLELDPNDQTIEQVRDYLSAHLDELMKDERVRASAASWSSAEVSHSYTVWGVDTETSKPFTRIVEAQSEQEAEDVVKEGSESLVVARSARVGSTKDLEPATEETR